MVSARSDVGTITNATLQEAFGNSTRVTSVHTVGAILDRKQKITEPSFTQVYYPPVGTTCVRGTSYTRSYVSMTSFRKPTQLGRKARRPRPLYAYITLIKQVRKVVIVTQGPMKWPIPALHRRHKFLVATR